MAHSGYTSHSLFVGPGRTCVMRLLLVAEAVIMTFVTNLRSHLRRGIDNFLPPCTGGLSVSAFLIIGSVAIHGIGPLIRFWDMCLVLICASIWPGIDRLSVKRLSALSTTHGIPCLGSPFLVTCSSRLSYIGELSVERLNTRDTLYRLRRGCVRHCTVGIEVAVH